MNKDEAREARLEAAYEEFLASCNNHGLCACDVCTGYPSFQSFKAAAASVDRRAIVEKAFNKLWSKLKIGAGSINGAETTKKAIDAILADMGGDDEQV